MAVAWTLAEAAAWLDPPIREDQLRAIVTALQIEPAGPRATHAAARPGRPARRYLATEIMALHGALAPWLVRAEAAREPAAPPS